MRRLFILMMLACSLMTCKQDGENPNYPKEPYIEFSKVEKFIAYNELTNSYSDSLRIEIYYRDGDLDLGMNLSDLESDCENGTYTYPEYKAKCLNYYLDVYQKKNGVFEKVVFPYELEYHTIFPRTTSYTPNSIEIKESLFYINPQNQWEGKMILKTLFAHFLFDPNTILKLKIQIKDRANNLSNVIETDEIIIREE